jgi:uncharacterized protein YbbC (DUF1343 family)
MSVKPGLEVLLEKQLDVIAGKRLGLIAGVSSTDGQLVSSVERLHEHPQVQLVALFGPEHGLRGEAQAGQHVTHYDDSLTGLPVYSLYGDTKKPSPEMLEGLDALVYDLQDGGLRFYTYLATLAYVMQAAAEAGLPVIVLDRPVFLNGIAIEGPILDPAYTSFVGPYPIPIRYGMTAGEIAGLFNTAFGIGCDLIVVPLEGWPRGMWFDQTGLPFVPPSPNLPNLSAINAYPGTCLVEGTNFSEGRGTTRPFEYIGAPWIQAETLARALNRLELPGVRFRPVYFVPTFSKHQGETCGGVHVYITDRETFRAVETGLHIIDQARAASPDQFAWRQPWADGGHYPIDLLSGGNQVRQHLDASKPVSDLVRSWEDDLQAFSRLRAQYLLYAE